jgi:hypothetical protein
MEMNMKTVNFTLENTAKVRIELKHVCGVPIRTLYSGILGPGEHNIPIGPIMSHSFSGREVLRYDLVIDGVHKDWWMFKVAS